MDSNMAGAGMQGMGMGAGMGGMGNMGMGNAFGNGSYGMGFCLPCLDQALSALLRDLRNAVCSTTRWWW